MTMISGISGTGVPVRAWRAAMIAPDCDKGQGAQASFVGTRLELAEVAPDATLHITAQGLYVCYINGVKVGDDYLTPGWTVYDDRLAYQSYPVAHLLRPGENRIEIRLGDGWWRSQLMWAQAPIFNCWGNKVAAMAEIEGGGAILCATGPDWAAGLLPVMKNGIYWGESVDARQAGLPADAGVTVIAPSSPRIVPAETAGIKALVPLHAVDTWADGAATVHDFGQNCAAIPRIEMDGPAGASVLIEFCEQLAPGRVWDNRNYRSARAALDYVLAGGPVTWEPEFTFMGYRYARITPQGGARVTGIVSVPLTSVPEQRGTFASGHALVNRLVENTVWSQRSNFVDVPTDCPQRDERLGWTGDAQVFAGTACWLADSHAFLRKYLRDVMADQREDGAIPHFSPDPTRLHVAPEEAIWAGSTGWGDAICIIPWQLYLHYGDREILEECLPAMLRWLDYLWSISNGPVIQPHATWGKKGFTFGDWLQPTGSSVKPQPTIGDDCAATLYHFISTDLTARIAETLGDAALAGQLRAKAATIAAAFEHEFITPSGRIANNDQTSYALAFLYGLVPARHHDAAKAYFARVVEDAGYKIGTGFIGTPALLPALTMLGLHDHAGRVFLNEDVPGWLFQVRMGATTIWERWDALAPDGSIYDPSMNSYNHYAYGAVCQWLFEAVAGMAPDPDHPGFAGIILDPVIIPALSPVAATHQSLRGPVAAGWVLEGDTVTYTVSIPDGVTARMAARPGLTVNGTAQSGPVTLTAGTHVMTFHQS
ncbi:MAG: family 78 glycoside hydrolase catalytic domain [Rubellimicrobium sp.]|nr:family 78 glycoside hydrolase catalytic domain [Rubellimicrobium sp.]